MRILRIGRKSIYEKTSDSCSNDHREVVSYEEEAEEDLFLLAADGQDGTYSGTDGNVS